MKLFFVVFVSALALWAKDPQTQKKQTPETPKVAAKAAPKVADAAATPAGVPTDAVKDAGGHYRYTDPEGKKWIYRKSPFGMIKVEDIPEFAAAPDAASGPGIIKVTEDGDIVRFERPGPFGVSKWEKKKSELDESEKAALQNSQAHNSTVSKQD